MVLTKTYNDGTTPTIAIIGAGISGLCAAIQLQRQLNLTSYQIFEMEADIGGTWYNNTYPGCACDNLSHLYHYSFAPNCEWTKRYVSQEEIHEYLRSTARTYNIYDKISFNKRIIQMRWDQEHSKWELQWEDLMSRDRGTFVADVVFYGAGAFAKPKIPKEFEAFTGPKWHSARWRTAADVAGKTVGIVGTSASAVQIISGITSTVKALHIYGRSPVHIVPGPNASYSSFRKWLFRRVPLLHWIYCLICYYAQDFTFPIYCKPAWYSFFHRIIASTFLRWNLYWQVSDPELRRKLTPGRPLGSRRTVISTEYYAAVQQDHVEYHRAHISEVQGTTVTLEDGSKQDLDVLIMATGFDMTLNFPVNFWTGRGDIDMATLWSQSASTYFGACAPNAPNFYMGWGPRSGSQHHSLVSIVEAQVMVMIKCLSSMMASNYATMEISAEATEEFCRVASKRFANSIHFIPNPSSLSSSSFQKTLATSPGPYSSGFWSGSLTEFRWRLSKVHSGLFMTTQRSTSFNGE